MIPGPGKGRPPDLRRDRRPDWVARRMEARRGETPDTGRWLAAQRDSVATRSEARPVASAMAVSATHTGDRRPWLSNHGQFQHIGPGMGFSLMD